MFVVLFLFSTITTPDKSGASGDWAVSRGSKCTYCRSHELECNYTHGTREEKQGISETCVEFVRAIVFLPQLMLRSYIDGLESCVKKMTAYFNRVSRLLAWRLCLTYAHQFYPDIDLSKEFGVPSDLDGWMRNRKLPDDSASAFLSDDPGPSAINLAPSVKDEPNSSDEDAYKLSDIQDRLQNMHIVDRFLGQASVLGKSSSVSLIKTTLDMKRPDGQGGLGVANIRSRRGKVWGPNPVTSATVFLP
jgi:hypothetical protein